MKEACVGRKSFALFLTVALVVGTVALGGGPAVAKAKCAKDGAEWPAFGNDLFNSRSQPAEKKLDAAALRSLTTKFAFSSTAGGGTGNFQSTPVIADGCVFVGTTTGDIFALNATTGDVVWSATGDGGAIIGGVFAVSVKYGRVYAMASGAAGPTAFALDQDTGKKVWTARLKDPSSNGINASAVVFNGLMFAGVFGGDGDPTSHPPYFILDAETGDILAKEYIIPKKKWKKGYAGSGIWATAAVDAEHGYVYAGTTNPYSKEKEHKHTNAILKIDADPRRRTFGEIVKSYKGNVDQYIPGLDKQPACELLGDYQPAGYSVVCFQLDIDFGASPNLFAEDGRLLVGELQKSGVYHVADANTMKPVWSAILTAPMAAGNSGTSAVDQSGVYVAVNGAIYGLERRDGSQKWVSPMPDAMRYQTVSVANGVVYVIDNAGTLHAFDAETGSRVLTRPMPADVGEVCVSLSGGVSIANGTIYATCDIGVTGGGWTVAYGA